MKVAVIDVIRVLDESKTGLAGAKQLEALFNEQQRELAPLLQQHKQKKPPEAKLQKQIEDRMKEHEQAREKMRVELREALLAKMKPIMHRLATESGADMVLGRAQMMLFVKPELDLTNAVMTELDAGVTP